MGHSIHNVDITKPLTHTTSAICPIQWKPWRGHLFKVSDAIECEHFPTQVGYDDKLQSGRDPDENNDEHADELTWDGFWQFMQKSLVIQTNCCNSCLGGMSQTILEVKMLDVEVLAGVVTHGLRLWCRLDVLPNSLKHLWRRLMVVEK